MTVYIPCRIRLKTSRSLIRTYSLLGRLFLVVGRIAIAGLT